LPDAVPDPLLARLRAALDNLEAAAERRARQDAARADAEAEFALMQDDRARLAVELDAALDAQRALAEANAAAMERVTRAAGVIEGWLKRAGA
jgi:predicted deacylase